MQSPRRLTSKRHPHKSKAGWLSQASLRGDSFPATSFLSLATEACSHGFYDGSVRIVIFHCPYISSAQTAWNLQIYIDHLKSSRDAIVISVEGFAGWIVERYGDSPGIEVIAV